MDKDVGFSNIYRHSFAECMATVWHGQFTADRLKEKRLALLFGACNFVLLFPFYPNDVALETEWVHIVTG